LVEKILRHAAADGDASAGLGVHVPIKDLKQRARISLVHGADG